VVAHLALNAEGLAGALRGLLDASHRTMYVSDEARHADVEALAAEPPEALRERLRTAAGLIDTAIAELPHVPADARFDRTPGGQSIPAARVPLLRLREVEFHHADLDRGYGYRDWPPENATAFVDVAAKRYDGPPIVLRAIDDDRTWHLAGAGEDAPVVSGPLGALAWWLSGRDPGDGLTSTTALPTVEGL
jgi:maleylpyruvate isomerase